MTVSKVFLTGAGGFVGGRVAHRIGLREGTEIKALLHNPSGPGAMRLARLPIEIEQGSVRDRDRLTALVDDCDAVINCAFGMGKTSVEGTRNLLEVTNDAGIDSFVHLSSAAVHGHGHEGRLRESAPFEPDTEYAEWKVKGERTIASFAERADLQPAIIRPMIVYGPYSQWVTETIAEIREGATMTKGGYGTLNQIYIDNLVDAIILALNEPAANGEVFLAVDDDTVSWRRYYSDLRSVLEDAPPLQTSSRRKIRTKRRLQLVTDSVVPPIQMVKELLTSDEIHGTVTSNLGRTPWAEPMVKRLPGPMRKAVIAGVADDRRENVFRTLRSDEVAANGQRPDGRKYTLPSDRYMKMQSTTGEVSNEKLKDTLGWEQRVRYDESMDLISAWLEYERISA